MRLFTVNRTANGRIIENSDGNVRSELYVPMMKFDERTGEFKAWSTVDEIDGHKERCDVEKSWPALVKWAGEQEELSKGKSVGNLRVQHRRDSNGGKVTLMELREMDGKPAVYIEGKVTNDQAKADVVEGVITGISVRGLSAKYPDPENPGVTRYAWVEVEEKSLVDRPAVAHALIEVMKSDGGIEMVKALGRQPKQFWDCGLDGCQEQHERKEDALKCEGLPTRIEAKVKSEDEAQKSLYRVADLVALLSHLLAITNDADFDATWDAINNGDDSGKALVAQLKQIAQRVFDALEAMIADERAELEADLTTEQAMSFAMRALAESETAKQLMKSLRVPSGNGSKTTSTETVKQEDTMKTIEELQKSLEDQGKAHIAKVEELQKALTKTTEDLAASSKQVAEATTKVAELEKNVTTLSETVIESAKAQAKTLVLVTGVKVADDTNLVEVLKAIANKPAPTMATQRLVPVSKAADTDVKPDEKKPLSPLEKLSPANRTRLA